MSVIVNLKQKKGFLKKPVKIEMPFLQSAVYDADMYFGIPNEAYVIDQYEGGNDIRETLFVLYRKDIYGRGMSFLVDKDYNIELVLNNPATQRDIESFYKVIAFCCKQLKLDSFEQEDEIIKLNDIESKKNEIIGFNKSLIKGMFKPDLTLFGAIYPIAIEAEFIESLENMTEDEAYSAYEKYLDEKQKMDCYFAKPSLFNTSQDGEYIVARYVLTEDVPSIFPVSPYLPFGYRQELKEKVQEWNVIIAGERNGKMQALAQLSFDELLNMLDREKLGKFDASHYIVKIEKDFVGKLR